MSRIVVKLSGEYVRPIGILYSRVPVEQGRLVSVPIMLSVSPLEVPDVWSRAMAAREPSKVTFFRVGPAGAWLRPASPEDEGALTLLNYQPVEGDEALLLAEKMMRAAD